MTSLTILASAARTATNTSLDFNLNHGGYGRFFCDLTAVPGVDTVTFEVQGKDLTSGKYVTLLASTAQSAAGMVTLEVGPGLTAAANATANRVLPDVFRVRVVHSAATSFTYSVGLDYL